MTHNPESFARTWNKSQPDAVERLRAALQQAREQRGTHAAWARLCKEAGQDNLALIEYQLALRDNSDDATP